MAYHISVYITYSSLLNTQDPDDDHELFNFVDRDVLTGDSFEEFDEAYKYALSLCDKHPFDIFNITDEYLEIDHWVVSITRYARPVDETPVYEACLYEGLLLKEDLPGYGHSPWPIPKTIIQIVMEDYEPPRTEWLKLVHGPEILPVRHEEATLRRREACRYAWRHYEEYCERTYDPYHPDYVDYDYEVYNPGPYIPPSYSDKGELNFFSHPVSRRHNGDKPEVYLV